MQNLPPDPKLASEVLKHNSKLQESLIRAGWLGKFFGTNSRVPVYIAGLAILLLLLTGISYSFLSLYNGNIPFDNVIKLWGLITPVITLSLGYIFGKGTRGDNEASE
jgi:hypothetical protein